MKKSLLLLLFTFMVAVGCKESTTESQPDVDSADYFPNSDGNYYYYNIIISDSTGSQSGTRKSYFNGDTTLLLTPYQIRVDTFLLNSNQTIISSYFRKSSTGIFNYVGIDTTGFSGLVPDSLQGGISFDSEYRLIYQPLSLNQTWPVYKVRADLIYTEFDLFTIDALVLSKELMTIAFGDTTYTREVYKIKYNANLITGLNQPPVTFEAYCLIADTIGLVKWEGNSELLNFFAGVNVYPLNSIVIEELDAFNIN